MSVLDVVRSFYDPFRRRAEARAEYARLTREAARAGAMYRRKFWVQVNEMARRDAREFDAIMRKIKR